MSIGCSQSLNLQGLRRFIVSFFWWFLQCEFWCSDGCLFQRKSHPCKGGASCWSSASTYNGNCCDYSHASCFTQWENWVRGKLLIMDLVFIFFYCYVPSVPGKCFSDVWYKMFWISFYIAIFGYTLIWIIQSPLSIWWPLILLCRLFSWYVWFRPLILVTGKNNFTYHFKAFTVASYVVQFLLGN